MILVRVQYLILCVYGGTLYDPGEGTIPHSLRILYWSTLYDPGEGTIPQSLCILRHDV